MSWKQILPEKMGTLLENSRFQFQLGLHECLGGGRTDIGLWEKKSQKPPSQKFKPNICATASETFM